MPNLTFYFDYRSPYAYLAHTQLCKLGVDISYRPFDIRALMQQVENLPTSVICKPKNRYVQADLRRWAAYYRVDFQRHPDIANIDFRRLLRATLCGVDQQRAADVVKTLFDAVWGNPKPLQTPADVTGTLARVGVQIPGVEVTMDEPHWDAALVKATVEAAERGVFGAPCMFVGEEMFFGNDRLDFVRVALDRAA